MGIRASLYSPGSNMETDVAEPLHLSLLVSQKMPKVVSVRWKRMSDRPISLRYSGLPTTMGLTEALREGTPIRLVAKAVNHDRLWLLSSGFLAADSSSLLRSERLKSRFIELQGEFEFVIVDGPPMTPYSDAIALGKLSDGVVLALEAESTRREVTLAVAGESSICSD
jgi:Mrp family chromosome partitioning ATPase